MLYIENADGKDNTPSYLNAHSQTSISNIASKQTSIGLRAFKTTALLPTDY